MQIISRIVRLEKIKKIYFLEIVIFFKYFYNKIFKLNIFFISLFDIAFFYF